MTSTRLSDVFSADQCQPVEVATAVLAARQIHNRALGIDRLASRPQRVRIGVNQLQRVGDSRLRFCSNCFFSSDSS